MDLDSAKDTALIVFAAQTFASFLNIYANGNTNFGKVINLIALGFGKAKPDPLKQ